MAFRLGDIIVKDIIYALASNITTEVPLYVLTQLSEATINITSDSNDITDKDGNIVKKNYRSKSGELQATNAFLNANVLAAAGATTDIAAVDNVLVAPKIIKVPKSQVAAVLRDVVSGSITVTQYFGDGAIGTHYELGVEASDTEYAITTGSTTIYDFQDVSASYVIAESQSAFPAVGDATKGYIDASDGNVYTWDSTLDTPAYVLDATRTVNVSATRPTTGENDALYLATDESKVYKCEVTTTPDGTTTVTLPTDPEADYYMIKYKRTFTEGAIIKNSANKFPTSVNLLMKVLYFDPCSKDTVKAAYVELPSFMVSPETSISFNPESPTMDFNGTLEIDYCSDDKELYRIYFVDEEDAA